MKVGLKLDWQRVINMTHVVGVVMFDNCFDVNMVGGLTYLVIRDSGAKNSCTYDESIGVVVVDAKEYYRIQEELSEYLGVEIKDSELEVS